jgi:hypothetical protein
MIFSSRRGKVEHNINLVWTHCLTQKIAGHNNVLDTVIWWKQLFARQTVFVVVEICLVLLFKV